MVFITFETNAFSRVHSRGGAAERGTQVSVALIFNANESYLIDNLYSSPKELRKELAKVPNETTTFLGSVFRRRCVPAVLGYGVSQSTPRNCGIFLVRIYLEDGTIRGKFV